MVDPDAATPVCRLEDAWTVGADPYLETSLDHPEGVAVARDGTLYAGGEAGQVYRVDPETDRVELLADSGGFSLGVTLDADEENLYVCDFQEHALFELPLDADGTANGDLRTVLRGTKEDVPIQPNDAVFDTDDRLYVTDSGDRTAPMDRSGGCVLVYEPDGSVRVLTDDLDAWPNGLALSRDESILYVAETGRERVSAVHLDDGEASDVEPVTGAFGAVDGIALDADPEGLTMCNPTNLAFGGPEMRTIYVANLGLPHVTAVELDGDGRGRLPTARA